MEGKIGNFGHLERIKLLQNLATVKLIKIEKNINKWTQNVKI